MNRSGAAWLGTAWQVSLAEVAFHPATLSRASTRAHDYYCPPASQSQLRPFHSSLSNHFRCTTKTRRAALVAPAITFLLPTPSRVGPFISGSQTRSRPHTHTHAHVRCPFANRAPNWASLPSSIAPRFSAEPPQFLYRVPPNLAALLSRC
jgi:hypothetical protein